jgi:hypothetical protein
MQLVPGYALGDSMQQWFALTAKDRLFQYKRAWRGCTINPKP